MRSKMFPLSWLVVFFLYSFPLKTFALFTKIDGAEIFYECVGQKEANVTIVFITGQGVPSQTWSPVVEKMKKKIRFCRYDRPSIGKSSRGKVPTNIDRQEKEFTQVVKKMEIKGRYVLVGHSLGGSIAKLHSIRHEENVKGIVLVESSSHLSDTKSLIKTFLKDKKDPDFSLYKDIYKKWQFFESAKGYVVNGEGTDWSVHNYILKKELRRVDLPLAVIMGKETSWIAPPFYPQKLKKAMADEWIRANRNHLTFSKKETELKFVNTGHMIPLERPQELAELIDDFLDTI